MVEHEPSLASPALPPSLPPHLLSELPHNRLIPDPSSENHSAMLDAPYAAGALYSLMIGRGRGGGEGEMVRWSRRIAAALGDGGPEVRDGPADERVDVFAVGAEDLAFVRAGGGGLVGWGLEKEGGKIGGGWRKKREWIEETGEERMRFISEGAVSFPSMA